MVIQGNKNGDLTFVCSLSRAKKVYLSGNFNKWNPNEKPMVKSKDGTFRATMKLPPGSYEYKFIVDGTWINDAEASCQVMNSYGTLNSLIKVQ